MAGGQTNNYGFPYPGALDPPDGATQLQALAEAVDDTFQTVITSGQIPLVAGPVLPDTPVDGQVFAYQAAADARWQMQYDAASGTWVFVGGVAVSVSVQSSGTISVGGGFDWQDLHASDVAGPDFTVPFDGDYRVRFSARLAQSGNGTTTQVGLSIAGVDPTANFVAQVGSAALGSPPGTDTGIEVQVAAVAGDRLRLLYRDNGSSGTATFSHRRLFVTPVSVTP